MLGAAELLFSVTVSQTVILQLNEVFYSKTRGGKKQAKNDCTKPSNQREIKVLGFTFLTNGLANLNSA